MLPPRVDNNTGIVHILGDTSDPAIVTQPHLLDEHELQIISATIEVQAAAPAWSLHHGILRYNERYYIPVTSLLLQDLLESLGTMSPHLLDIGLHTMISSPTTQAFPSSILLLEEWPERILPSTTIFFFDGNGQ
jgi:hypothetical protein